MTAPQPSRNARVITLRFVPGGPEPITNGFGSFSPSTVVARVAMAKSFVRELACLTNFSREFDQKIRANKAPNPKLQASEKLQYQSSNCLREFEDWRLEFLWRLD